MNASMIRWLVLPALLAGGIAWADTYTRCICNSTTFVLEVAPGQKDLPLGPRLFGDNER